MAIYDVILVGSGPAALGVASSLEAAHVNYLILERESQWGGIPMTCSHASFGLHLYKYPMKGSRFISKIAQSIDTSKIKTGATVLSIATESTKSKACGIVLVRTAQGEQSIYAKKIVLATGCRESTRHALGISGLRPLEIFSTGSLQRVCSLREKISLGKTVIVGTEFVSFSALKTVLDSGASVQAMVETDSRISTYRMASLYPFIKGIPVHYNSCVKEIHGTHHLEGITLQQQGKESFIPCESLIFSGHFVGEHSLLYQSGLEDLMGRQQVMIDQYGHSSAPVIMACGNMVHPGDPGDQTYVEGCLMGKELAQEIKSQRNVTGKARISCSPELASHIQYLSWKLGSPLRTDIFLHPRQHLDGKIQISVNNKIIREKRGHFLPRYRTAFKKVDFSAHRKELEQGAPVTIRFSPTKNK